MKKRICVITGSRADYGLLCWVMKEIEKRTDLELIAVVTGMHLSRKYGYTAREVMNDGFKNLVKIKVTDEASPLGIAKASGQIVNRFAAFFSREKVDVLVLLGDRFEMLAAAIAVLPFNIPIAHIGGGEITEGAIDDSVRHALTKMSHLHFPITKKCAERIKQMGEEAWRIKVTGSPRLDSKNNIKFKSRSQLGRQLGIDFTKKVALVVYHPTTVEAGKTGEYVDNLLRALSALDMQMIMFYPNLDTCSDIIIRRIEAFAKKNRKVKLLKPLKQDDYFSVLKAASVLIGNSSIGIVEAPSFRLPVVNIGDRQRGRDHVQNVINVGNGWKDILSGIEKALYDKKFLSLMRRVKNPYGNGKASKRIADVLSDIDLRTFRIMKKSRFN